VWGVVSWRKHIVTDDLIDSHAVFAADLDGNETTDVLGTDAEGHQVLWWQNLHGNGSDISSTIPLCTLKRLKLLISMGTETSMWCGLPGMTTKSPGGGTRGNPITWTKDVIQSEFRWTHRVQTAEVYKDGHFVVQGAAYAHNAIA
jgi:hypothetical protein